MMVGDLSALSSWMTLSWSLAGGKAPVTRVEKLFSSHLRISQQFLREDTPGSRVDKADWLLAGEIVQPAKDGSVGVQLVTVTSDCKHINHLDWSAMNMRCIQVLACLLFMG